MRVRLDLNTFDDAPACSRIARPVGRALRGGEPAASALPTRVPSSTPTPAHVRADVHYGGAPRPDGHGEPAR